MKVTKELFEAVMETKNIVDIIFESGDVIAHYYRTDKKELWKHSESIDTFFFKCKEWAYNKQNRQYYIESGYTKYDCYAKVWFDGGRNKEFKADSEQQAVFNACQWILENQDVKK